MLTHSLVIQHIFLLIRDSDERRKTIEWIHSQIRASNSFFSSGDHLEFSPLLYPANWSLQPTPNLRFTTFIVFSKKELKMKRIFCQTARKTLWSLIQSYGLLLVLHGQLLPREHFFLYLFYLILDVYCLRCQKMECC